MDRLESAVITLGRRTYPYTVEGVGLNILRVQIAASVTEKFTSVQELSIKVVDSVIGEKTSVIGWIETTTTNVSAQDITLNDGYDLYVPLVVTDAAIAAASLLYNVLRGKTAYEYAVEGGYEYTEEQFYLDLAKAALAVPYNGANDDLAMGEHSVSADSVRLDPTPRDIARIEGEIYYDPAEQAATLHIGDDGDISLGKEPYDLYRNNESSPIVDGDVVSLVPTPGMTIGVMLTDATDDTLSNAVVGMVTVTSIGANQIGRITKSGGRVRNLNTSAYAEGTLLFVDPANKGKWTSVRPMAPDHIIEIGVVAVPHLNQGVVELKINEHPKIIELSDVDGITDAIADAEYFLIKKDSGVHQYITFEDLKAILKAYNDTLYYGKDAIDNTVSTLQLKSEKGQANGYASLDADGLVPANQLPSYVDDVLEFANLAAFPVTGATGKIYVALDTNKTYRWSGSTYVYITSGAVDSVAGKTGIVTLVKADVGLANVDNTSDTNKPVSTAQQTALDLKIDKTLPTAITTIGDTETMAVKAVDNIWKRITWANIKTLLETFFNAKYVSFTGDQSIGGVKTFSSSPIVPTPTNATDTANKGYVDTAVVDSLPAATAALLPALAYKTRTDADSGSIQSMTSISETYLEALDLMASALFMWDGRAGMKTRTVGANTYATKIYDMGVGIRDASQATEANQPLVSGVIAPNESRKLKTLKKDVFGTLSISPIIFTPAESWSITSVLKWNGENINETDSHKGIYVNFTNSSDGLYFNRFSRKIGFQQTGIVNETSETNTKYIGKNTIITQGYVAGYGGFICVNGVAMPMTTRNVNTDNVVISSLFAGFSRMFLGELTHVSVHNKALSASEIINLHTYLRTQHPEIETVNVGGYQIASSNCEIGAVSDGTTIPEVQANGFTNNVVNPDFESAKVNTDRGNHTSAIVLDAERLSNVLEITATGAGINGVDCAIWLKNNGLTKEMTDFANLWIKITFKAKRISGINQIRVTNTNIITPPIIITDEWQTYTSYLKQASAGSGVVVYTDGADGVFRIDDLSFATFGWSNSTELYDYVKANTTGTTEQKEIAALKAASMWSYNENLPATGAWAGKLLNEYAVRLLNRYTPTGTHIPTEAEWNAVIALLGTATVAGKKMKALSNVYWTTASGTNESGLSVIGAASRNADGTFATILGSATIWTATDVDADNAKALVIADGADTATMTNTSKKIGASVRLFLNSPFGEQSRTVETTTVVNFASGTANVDVVIPWGYKVEGVTVESTTGLTDLQCVLYTGAGSALETLFTGKAVTANVQKYLTADADQSVQKVDAFLRFNGVKADTGGSVKLSIRLEKAL